MRPGPIRPGDLLQPGRHGLGLAVASMRPGPIRPGDEQNRREMAGEFLIRFNEARADSPGRSRPAPQPRQLGLASMRPGPIRPGDAQGRGEHPPGSGGFNEARADSPGRSWRRPCRGSPPRCFNEARADSPGRLLTRPPVLVRSRPASMRPGPIRPGDSHDITGLSGPLELQ